MLRIAPAAVHELAEVRILFREYSALVSEALCFQNFDQEMEQLPGEYVPPGGVILLASDDAGALGCVALRRLDETSSEMKRMYVRDRGRGQGVGRKLAVAVIEEARSR